MIVQKHHIVYASKDHPSQEEVTVYLTKGEHGILTRLSWWCKKTVSKGFIRALKIWIAMREDEAITITEEDYDRQQKKSKTK